jgi:hypothetical protein
MPAPDDDWERGWVLRIGSASPSFWAEVARMQLQRIERGAEAHRRRELHPERRSDRDGFAAALAPFGPMQADAYFLLVAVRHLLDLADRYGERYGEAAVRALRARFDAAAPDAKDLRDVLSHLEEYVVGRGKRKRFEADGQWLIQLGMTTRATPSTCERGTCTSNSSARPPPPPSSPQV